MATAAVMPVYENEQGYVDTWGVGGDRFAFLPSSMFSPQPFVGTTSPVPTALLSIPPTYNQLNSANQDYGTQGAAARQGASAPWSPKSSLVPWVIVSLIVGLYGIHTLYYKDKRKK
jgi:hypothetical protein